MPPTSSTRKERERLDLSEAVSFNPAPREEEREVRRGINLIKMLRGDFSKDRAASREPKAELTPVIGGEPPRFSVEKPRDVRLPSRESFNRLISDIEREHPTYKVLKVLPWDQYMDLGQGLCGVVGVHKRFGEPEAEKVLLDAASPRISLEVVQRRDIVYHPVINGKLVEEVSFDGCPSVSIQKEGDSYVLRIEDLPGERTQPLGLIMKCHFGADGAFIKRESVKLEVEANQHLRNTKVVEDDRLSHKRVPNVNGQPVLKLEGVDIIDAQHITPSGDSFSGIVRLAGHKGLLPVVNGEIIRSLGGKEIIDFKPLVEGGFRGDITGCVMLEGESGYLPVRDGEVIRKFGDIEPIGCAHVYQVKPTFVGTVFLPNSKNRGENQQILIANDKPVWLNLGPEEGAMKASKHDVIEVDEGHHIISVEGASSFDRRLLIDGHFVGDIDGVDVTSFHSVRVYNGLLNGVFRNVTQPEPRSVKEDVWVLVDGQESRQVANLDLNQDEVEGPNLWDLHAVAGTLCGFLIYDESIERDLAVLYVMGNPVAAYQYIHSSMRSNII